MLWALVWSQLGIVLPPEPDVGVVGAPWLVRWLLAQPGQVPDRKFHWFVVHSWIPEPEVGANRYKSLPLCSLPRVMLVDDRAFIGSV